MCKQQWLVLALASLGCLQARTIGGGLDGGDWDGGHQPDGGDPGSIGSMEQYCSARADALCAWQQRCGNLDPVDLDLCRALYSNFSSDRFHMWRYGGNPTIPVPLNAQDCACGGSYRATLNPAQAQRCIESVRTAACDPPLVNQIVFSGCDEALSGKLDDGAECAADVECKTGFCNYASDATSGHCIQTRRAGEACTSGICGRGLFCDFAVTNTCQPQGGAGAPCSTASSGMLYTHNWWCAPGFVCSPPGTCVPETRATGGTSCWNLACPDGQVCVSNGCTNRLDHGAKCYSGCDGTSPCPMLETCLEGKCQIAAGPGAPCSPFQQCMPDGPDRIGYTCRIDARCENQNCVAVPRGTPQTERVYGCTDTRPWW